jgi:hypothetical protein
VIQLKESRWGQSHSETAAHNVAGMIQALDYILQQSVVSWSDALSVQIDCINGNEWISHLTNSVNNDWYYDNQSSWLLAINDKPEPVKWFYQLLINKC